MIKYENEEYITGIIQYVFGPINSMNFDYAILTIDWMIATLMAI